MNLVFENYLWSRGFDNLAGIDEVGRGSFAGPLVSGMVVFGPELNTKIGEIDVKITDSKKLTVNQKKVAYKWIINNSLYWDVGIVGPEVIDKKGIVSANHSAFRRVVEKVQDRSNSRVDYLLLDAYYVPDIEGFPISLSRANVFRKQDDLDKKGFESHIKKYRQLAIVKGDEKSFLISCASIVAKVYRDNLMCELANEKSCQVYGWDENSGYGTLKHRNAIKEHGITKHHRLSFVKKYLTKD